MRELWRTAALASLAAISSSAGGATAPPRFAPSTFLYGASVYPEIQTEAETARMLDLFQAAGFNTVRVGESSWGNLEPRVSTHPARPHRRSVARIRRKVSHK